MIKVLDQISPESRALRRYMAKALRKPLPKKVVERAQNHILDTLAAMVSGSRLLPGRRAIAYVADLGKKAEAGVIGTRLVLPVANAALANAMSAHADETDDSHPSSHTHPGCAMVPAALAVAEKTHASGRDFLRAVVLGYDVGCRLTKALDMPKFVAALRSSHSYGCTFGSAAAAGALLHLKEEEMGHLLSYAAQTASGGASHVRDREHIEKAYVMAARPCYAGVTIASMVASGFTGVDDVFSGERNFLDAFSPDPHPEELCAELGSRYEIMFTNIKKWCVGSPIQAALDSIEFLMKEEGLTAASVDRIQVHIAPRSARTVDAAPMANINLQHLLSLMLVDGTITFASCHDDRRMKDRPVAQLARRITIVPDEEIARAKPVRQAIVKVRTKDGRDLTKRTYAVRGTVENPMTANEVAAKAHDLMAPILGRPRASRLVDTIFNLETLADTAQLRPLLAAATPRETPRRRSR